MLIITIFVIGCTFISICRRSIMSTCTLTRTLGRGWDCPLAGSYIIRWSRLWLNRSRYVHPPNTMTQWLKIRVTNWHTSCGPILFNLSGFNSLNCSVLCHMQTVYVLIRMHLSSDTIYLFISIISLCFKLTYTFFYIDNIFNMYHFQTF